MVKYCKTSPDLDYIDLSVLKLIGEARTVAGFNQLGFPVRFRVAIGMLEMIGGIALLFRNSSRYGVMVLSTIMIGAIKSTLVLGQVWEVIMPAVMLCILAMIGVTRKPIRRVTHSEQKRQDYSGV